MKVPHLMHANSFIFGVGRLQMLVVGPSVPIVGLIVTDFVTVGRWYWTGKCSSYGHHVCIRALLLP